MPSETFQINLPVAGKPYPITIQRVNEEKFRKAAKLINDKIDEYKNTFEVEEPKDYLAMAALQLVSELVELQKHTDVNPVFEIIRDLDIALQDTIKNIPKG